jgi:hypothetical protein
MVVVGPGAASERHSDDCAKGVIMGAMIRSSSAVSRHRRIRSAGRRLSRFGAAAMALALLIQISLPFVPMPSMAGDAATTLDQAVAAWGIGNLCLSPGERPRSTGDKQDFGAGHDCPVCQLTQQVSGLVPPSPLPGLWTPPAACHAAFVVRLEAPAHFITTASRPRAPPLSI